MSVRAAADESFENLKTALAEGKLPPNVADTATKLCERLNEPVRVSVMGLPGSGKSTVVNLLLNQTVVPHGVRLPTTQFVKGEVPQAICTLGDGSIRPVHNNDVHLIAKMDPIFIEFHLPLPALGRISVLEVVAPETTKDQQRAMHWAAKRTDIALWCTKEFTSIEQALWGSLPESVKDHAFMLLTHADQLARDGSFERFFDELRFGSEHEFHKIMPIATTDAIAARRADGTTDKALMQKSGGLTLISSILRQVDRGLQATVDQADLILHKFKDATPNPENARIIERAKGPRVITKPMPKSESTPMSAKLPTGPVIVVDSDQPVAAAAPMVPASTPKESVPDAFVLRGKSAVYNPLPPDPKPDTAPADDATATDNAETVDRVETAEQPPKVIQPMRVVTRPHSTPRPGSQPLAEGAGTSAATADPAATKKPRVGFMPKVKTTVVAPRARPETCAAYAEAVAYLTKQGNALRSRLATEGVITSEDLMAAASENISWLSDYLDDLQVGDDPVLEKARTRVLDASELVQLMQFEESESSGLEALTLVVQLKRDLETEIARSKQAYPVKAA